MIETPPPELISIPSSILDWQSGANPPAKPLVVDGAPESFIQLVLAAQIWKQARDSAGTNGGRLVVILPSSKELARWAALFELNIEAIAKATGHPVEGSSLPYATFWGADRYLNQGPAKRHRLFCFAQLTQTQHAAVIFTTVAALAQKTFSPEALLHETIRLQTGAEMDVDQLAVQLQELGYRRVQVVEDQGAFALRGGLIDIFSPAMHLPVRVEFLGDTVASLRTFSPSDQRSIDLCDTAQIAPCDEIILRTTERPEKAQALYNCLLDQPIDPRERDGMVQAVLEGSRFRGLEMFAPILQNQLAPGFSYINSPETVIVFPKSAELCIQTYEGFHHDLLTAYQGDVALGKPSLHPTSHFCSPDEVRMALSLSRQRIDFSSHPPDDGSRQFQVTSVSRYHSAASAASAASESDAAQFERWAQTIVRMVQGEDSAVVILTRTPESAARIANLMTHRGVNTSKRDDALIAALQGTAKSGTVTVGTGDLSTRIWLETARCLVIPEFELFGAEKQKTRRSPTKLQNYLNSFKNLHIGDLIVHVQHNIGRYQGITPLKVAGSETEFLILEYQAGDKIYVPVDKMGLLQRYSSGGDGAGPASLDRLGGIAWERRKDRVRKAVEDMAERLLKIQAERALAASNPYTAPGDLYYQFEAEFPYDETPDQLKAIEDVNSDLSAPRAMDRLICGDVGFGKTEVAMRAVFRAVIDGFQALVLTPTTVLCFQHHKTFLRRLGKHGVRVEQVNRFIAPKAAHQTLKAFEEGKIDVLVGTHRLLSKDVKPRRLGLLVIDEEQRFGVTHKERLKEMRANADVLTLTATPIPRTLHMSLLGLKDISIIATPPSERLSVRTYVSRFDETLVKQAIEQELRRGGQVFFVHNRVEDIAEIRNFIASLLGGIDVRIAHGQMPEHQLEKAIIDFVEQKFPVLVCTTIIESGIDMPNVNTLIVNRADCFGLAQLYQLRGRVGRSSLQAYAYFLTPAAGDISAEAQMRLEVLTTYQELGSGFHIASHDLEIRGAGNLLGGEQSGHVAEIGFELYTDMLERTIRGLRGQKVRPEVDTEIKIRVSAFIPTTYIDTEGLRLHYYKNLFSARTADEIDNLKREMTDRFGKPPPECDRLYSVATIKRQLKGCGAQSLAQSSHIQFEIRFGALTESQIATLLEAAQRWPDRYQLCPDC